MDDTQSSGTGADAPAVTKVVSKWRVDSVTKHSWNPDAITVKLSPVCSNDTPENQRFHKATPSGSMEMTITNPAVFDFYQLGAYVYADMTPAV